jgi:hypothetical protein
MVRTQIQLTEEQIVALRLLAAQQNKSMADLVREGVDLMLHRKADDSRVKRAMQAVGRFRSGRKDISVNHDEYLADAFEGREE